LKQEVKKMYATLLLPEYDHPGPISTTDAEKVFQQHHLWPGERKPKVKLPNRYRYEADYTNLIYHTYLHLFHHGGWIIAWIDDRDRMCLGFKFVPNKSSVETTAALFDVFRQYSAPYLIWVANGKEFKGTFQSILKERNSRHVYSAPYNPQRNGKCDRFWRTIEIPPMEDDIASLIAEYNRMPHFGLSPIKHTRGMGRKTLWEVWPDPSRQWRSGVVPYWSVDGVSLLFSL
jgi:hypothetical protein